MDKKFKSWWSDICKTKLNTLSRKSAEVRHSERSEESRTRKGFLPYRVPSFVIAHNVRKQTEVGFHPQDDTKLRFAGRKSSTLCRKSAVLDFLHARTTFVFEPSAQSDSMSSHTELSPVRKSAFTLAEVIVVLVLLGIIATITVPTLINKSTESAKITKVKKAMEAFERSMQSMIIENNIDSQEKFTSYTEGDFYGYGDGSNSDCSNQTKYFKIIQKSSSGSCAFKAADGLWWNLSELSYGGRATVAFAEEDLFNSEPYNKISKKAFAFYIYYDTNSKAFRINDYTNMQASTDSYVKSIFQYQGGKDQLKKTLKYVGIDVGSCGKDCIYAKINGEWSTPCESEWRSCMTNDGYYIQWYDDDGNRVADGTNYSDSLSIWDRQEDTTYYYNCTKSTGECYDVSVTQYLMDDWGNQNENKQTYYGYDCDVNASDIKSSCQSGSFLTYDDSDRKLTEKMGCDSNGQNCDYYSHTEYPSDNSKTDYYNCDSNFQNCKGLTESYNCWSDYYCETTCSKGYECLNYDENWNCTEYSTTLTDYGCW